MPQKRFAIWSTRGIRSRPACSVVLRITQGPVTVTTILINDIRDAASIVFNISANDLGPSPTEEQKQHQINGRKTIPNEKVFITGIYAPAVKL